MKTAVYTVIIRRGKPAFRLVADCDSPDTAQILLNALKVARPYGVFVGVDHETS